MKVFESEGSIQQWLSDQFGMGKSLAEIITNCENFEERVSRQQSFSLRKVIDSFNFCVSSFENNEVIVENKDISLSTKDILKPDL